VTKVPPSLLLAQVALVSRWMATDNNRRLSHSSLATGLSKQLGLYTPEQA